MEAKKRLLLILSVSIVAIALLIGREGFVALISGTNADKIPVSILRQELTSIAVPNDHKPVDQIKTFDRGIATGATQHFRAPSSSAVVANQYRRELEQKGWAFVSERDIAGNERAIKFCKSRMSLTLDMVEEGSMSTYYYLGVVWVNSKPDRAYCPDRDS